MSNPTCATCRFFQPDQHARGTCRRKAPRPYQPIFVTRPNGETDLDYEWLWPYVDTDDWCGEHEALLDGAPEKAGETPHG